MEDAIQYLKSFLKENKYIRHFNDKRICVMGGAYERYPLAVKWTYEELIENTIR